VVLKPIGRDVPDDSTGRAEERGRGCDHCESGAGRCGSGGNPGPGSDSSHGCADCGVKRLLAGRRLPVSSQNR
jgi:hypothetical protein